MNTIADECRMNLLIMKEIVPHLENIREGPNYDSARDSHRDISQFKTKNVRSLVMENQHFFRSDFIAKFIKMNRLHFNTLRLKNVNFKDHIKDLETFLRNQGFLKIKALSLNSCDIGDSSITNLLSDC